MLNKYEVIGIGASIAVMALALWLVRLETVDTVLSERATNTASSGVVYVAEGGDQAAAVADALVGASENGGLKQLVIDDVVLGVGEEVKEGDTVTVHYIGTLQNGQQFDNSYEKEQPFTFTVGEGRVIKGWDQGLLGMKTGGKRILVIPSELGYGKAGGGPIPANATLVFAVELLSIN